MKEKDIIDICGITINADGNLSDSDDIGCNICYIHDKAYEVINAMIEKDKNLYRYICPKCNKPLIREAFTCDEYYMAIVSEGNYLIPEGNIGYYDILHCSNPECVNSYGLTSKFAMMPIDVSYNANHGIYYTGGKDYIIDKDISELAKEVFKAVKPSIDQYVERKLNPKNAVDSGLNEWNINIWTSRDVEHVLAEWFYNHGYKK